MKPKVILHNSVSLDGRITGFMPDMGVHYGLLGTWSPDAHLAGSNTILAMPEEIPAEDPEGPEPGVAMEEQRGNDGGSILVIPDSGGRVRIWHFLKKQPFWNRFVALVSESTPGEYIEYLEKRGVGHIRTGNDRVDFPAAFEALNTEYGVKTILLDSGGTLNSVLLSLGLVDEMSLLVHPVVVGGEEPLTICKGSSGGNVLELASSETAGEGLVWLRYRVVH